MEDLYRLDIVLESKDGLYRGGQTLRGVVRVELEKSVDMIGNSLTPLYLYGRGPLTPITWK